MSHAIQIDALRYDVSPHFAIRDLAMRVPTGAVYGFLGPNGSGKTTLIRLLLGMLPPRDGTIRVLGHDIPSASSAALARIGYVPERSALYAGLSVEETLRFHRSFYSNWDDTSAQTMLRRFALRGEQKVSALSKGETGKLLMLLALAHRPELLVLDEPTDGLDPVVRRDVLAALVEYVEGARATVLISSHLVHEQERVCDWIGVMDGGRLIAELPMESFRAGIKRLDVSGAPPVHAAAPFTILAREPQEIGARERWVVRDWQRSHASWFAEIGATVHAVIDCDLEEGFVELLRSARAEVAR
ncbi:MAG: ABC transporter ATP-binding protein [Gemmatimonadaceae bacterium]|nr:ABC transporter ATP-binding protein [Gemmatimonadaceae bacterium]